MSESIQARTHTPGDPEIPGVLSHSGVYSNTEILAAVESGEIVIDPFNPVHVNGSSVDVTLGYYFFTPEDDAPQNGGPEKLYNPYDPNDVERYFGEVKIAEPLREHSRAIRRLGLQSVVALTSIPADHPIVILRPNERILAHTHEFIGIRGSAAMRAVGYSHGTSSMQARSTTGRNGLVVCMDAGWGDPGYVNRWTMEIKNVNEHEHIVVPVGIRIAQLVFYKTGLVKGEYANLSGKYQDTAGQDMERIKASWRPQNMLPKAYKDEISPPPKVVGLSEGLL